MHDGLPPIQKIVSSPRHAATILWQHNQDKYGFQYHRDQGKLYEISIDDGIVEEIDIPSIYFGLKIMNLDVRPDEYESYETNSLNLEEPCRSSRIH